MEKTLEKLISDKVFSIYIELITTHKKPIKKKKAKNLNKCLSKEAVQMTNKHIKRCSASLDIREM